MLTGGTGIRTRLAQDLPSRAAFVHPVYFAVAWKDENAWEIFFFNDTMFNLPTDPAAEAMHLRRIINKSKPCCFVGKKDKAYLSLPSPLSPLCKGMAQESWNALVEFLLCPSYSAFYQVQETVNVACEDELTGLRCV